MFTTEKFSVFLFFANAYNKNSEPTKIEMFTAENALHFIDKTKFKEKVTSKVVTRMLNPPVEDILPCYI